MAAEVAAFKMEHMMLGMLVWLAGVILAWVMLALEVALKGEWMRRRP